MNTEKSTLRHIPIQLHKLHFDLLEILHGNDDTITKLLRNFQLPKIGNTRGFHIKS